jgi:hypothetical protein
MQLIAGRTRPGYFLVAAKIPLRLDREPAIISRLHAAYTADRDPNKEMWVAKERTKGTATFSLKDQFVVC